MKTAQSLPSTMAPLPPNRITINYPFSDSSDVISKIANFMQPWLTPICHGHVSVLVLILHRTKILHITLGKKCQSFMNSNSKSWKLLLVTDTKSFRKHVFKKLISKKHEVTSIKVNTLSLLLKIWVPHIANIMNLFVFLIKNTER